ncbi:MAG: ATP adenylyltransferase [Cyanobium sp. CACIAM 14]|nr:MAG: ATP adenylyltransferase [Cyanobium sp. CACIAM 14]
MRAERQWHRAREVAERARRLGALVPLETEILPLPGVEPFVVRRLLNAPPRQLRRGGPRPNPFLPWDRPLQVDLLEPGHVLLLNKFPVQEAHLLVITRDWRPQGGWLEPSDWQAVAQVSRDTGGLWFFNSGARSGASQPHRHLQLLPRRAGESSCPLAPRLLAQLEGRDPPWRWAYQLSLRTDPAGSSDLETLYRAHALALGLGEPAHHPHPLHPYNLLFDDQWFMTVRRVREHCAGFSVNALGFAGYLLSTDGADHGWLERHGPWALLEAVAAAG